MQQPGLVPRSAAEMSRSSPKRKRGQESPSFSSTSPHPNVESDTQIEIPSPSTKVTGRFRRLAIDNRDPPLRQGSESADSASSFRLQQEAKTARTPSPTRGSRDNDLVDTNATTDSTDQAITSASPGSPRLSGQVNPFYWQDSEITGHDPKDPEDDLYGINGIGFRPTAAIAHQRSQQRKKQLVEYRNREAREARQKRSERRRTVLIDAPTHSKDSSGQEDRVKVHFDDG